jgi:hypothetical protein
MEPEYERLKASVYRAQMVHSSQADNFCLKCLRRWPCAPALEIERILDDAHLPRTPEPSTD